MYSTMTSEDLRGILISLQQKARSIYSAMREGQLDSEEYHNLTSDMREIEDDILDVIIILNYRSEIEWRALF